MEAKERKNARKEEILKAWKKKLPGRNDEKDRHFKVPAHLGFLNGAEPIWWGWGGEVGKGNHGPGSVGRSILLLTSFRIAGVIKIRLTFSWLYYFLKILY